MLSTPTVTLSAPPAGGIQAVASAVTAPTPSGIVQSGTVTAGGSGYTSAPTVTLMGDGTGATATATFVAATGAPVASVNLSSPGGQCYSSPPAVAFAGGGGTGAAASATLDSTPSCIQGWNVIGSCSARKGTTVSGVGVTGGGGTGFSGTITFKPGTGAVTSVSLARPRNRLHVSAVDESGCFSLRGCLSRFDRLRQSRVPGAVDSRYIGRQQLHIPADGDCRQRCRNIGNAGCLQRQTLGAPPANAGQVTGITITSGGSGYTTAPTVTIYWWWWIPGCSNNNAWYDIHNYRLQHHQSREGLSG